MSQSCLLRQREKLIRCCLAAVLSFAGFALGVFADEPIALPSASSQQDPVKAPDVQVIHDVAYRNLYEGEDASLEKNKLDIYIPRGKKDFPVIFLVHGGAWSRGNKNQLGIYSSLALSWARQGIGTVSINYRLSPGVKHPEHIKDVARAFAWTHKNIHSYGGRADQIFVCGHSAGGHLVALLATDKKYLQAEGLSQKNIRGAIPISGVYRIHDIQINAGVDSPRGVTQADAANGRNPSPPFSFVFGSDWKARRDASPLAHVKPGIPPFLVLYADSDLRWLPEMAREFSAAFGEQRCDVQTVEVKQRNHMSILLNITQKDDPAGQAILKFIAEHTR